MSLRRTIDAVRPELFHGQKNWVAMHRELIRTLRFCHASRIALAGLLTFHFAMRAAQAACLGALPQPNPPELEQLTMAAPVAALKIIELQLTPERSASLTREQRGALWAMAAEAYRQLSRSEAELQTANAGLAVQLPPASAVALRLHAIHALALDDHGAMRNGIAELEQVLADSASDPLAVACLRRERGWLRRSAGDTEGALLDLTFAREQLTRRGLRAEAMIATGRLAAVYAGAGEIDAAIALLRETVDYFTSLQAWVRVATARERLGDALLVRRDFDAAREQFREMRQFSDRAGDVLGVAYADLRTCASYIDEGQLQLAETGAIPARRPCGRWGPRTSSTVIC